MPITIKKLKFLWKKKSAPPISGATFKKLKNEEKTQNGFQNMPEWAFKNWKEQQRPPFQGAKKEKIFGSLLSREAGKKFKEIVIFAGLKTQKPCAMVIFF